ncbi:MAG: Pyridoxal phosphate homeostasis protein [Chloroflexi bacterium]|nr:Pyridoxal phosphate homeostasis protein [Chloroflexota bacterium]
MITLAEKLAGVNSRISQAASKAGRDRGDITLIGVTKTAGREAVEAAFQNGLRDFGENRIPDAETKFSPPPYPDHAARLHLIGHLQTNKAKRAVALADLIHSVDSVKLAQVISRHAVDLGKTVPVLLEINVSGEASKHGLSPAELPECLAQVIGLPNLEWRGLMTVAPYYENPGQTRPVFAALRDLFDRYNPGLPSWRDLSMGMTNDFEIAIEEGATLIRVGRAIFS